MFKQSGIWLFYRESLEKMVNQDQKENPYVFHRVSNTILNIVFMSVCYKWLKFSSLPSCSLKIVFS